MLRAFVTVSAIIALAACSSDATRVDTTSTDTSLTDTSTVDSSPVDSAPGASAETTGTNSTPPTSIVDTTPPSMIPSTPKTRVSHTTKKIGSLDGAVDVVERSPSDGFVYVVSRGGTVERWRHDGTRIGTVLDVSSLTTDEGERGLLGLAFRRGDSGAWAAYLNMTDLNGDTRIMRHAVSADGEITERGSLVLEIEQPYANHNGGDLRFGPDGMLYIATGDGGSGGDPERRAQDLTSLLGKVLRIDPYSGGYRVPSDNPYVGTEGARPEIWSIGLRNPWRFTIDERGEMWLADVGQNEMEEVSVVRPSGGAVGGRGADFGWSAWEGTRRYNDDLPAGNPINPVVEYAHENGRCSVSGGAVATQTSNPGRAGWFFYGDYCSGEVWSAHAPAGGKVTVERVATDLGNVSSVRVTSRAMWVTTIDGDVHLVTTTPN